MLLGLFFVAMAHAHQTGVHLSEMQVWGDREEGTGDGNSLLPFVPSSTGLAGHSLQKRREISLGETLKSEAGVQSTGFGPGASRPIIRGQEGDRIRVLQNGLGGIDASAQSVDHAVPIDTLNVERIEVVRGPMALLYGSSAVGGVVNVVNQRIHTQYEEGPLTQIESQYQTGSPGLGHAARLDYGKSKWMTHFDGSFRDYGDQRIPGPARSRTLRRDDPLLAGQREVSGRVNNSQSMQQTASGGVSRIFDRGYLGVSFGHFSSDYGSVAEKDVNILMRQNRWELAGEYRFEESYFDQVRFRSAQSLYQHDEMEGGSVGTVFRNHGNESRAELLRTRQGHRQVLGVQTQLFTFSAKGEEAFLPTSQNQIFALFAFHEIKDGANTYSIGGRAEDTRIGLSQSARAFTGLNGSLSAEHGLRDSSVGVNYSYVERAPNFQELFAQGAHVATGSYELGNQHLRKEKVHSLEASYKLQQANHKGRVGVFTQYFDRYVAQTPSGATDASSGFGIYQYRPVTAQFYGLDFEDRLGLTPQWSVLFKGDWVRGRNLSDQKNLPRISPGRLSIGGEYTRGTLMADAEVQQVFYQNQVSPNETRTAGYQLVNAGLSWDFIREEGRINLFLRLKNLLDAKGRQHTATATVKDLSPIMGRNLVAGMQLVF